jgi:hypothetical protein
MRANCIQAVQTAIGRSITQAEAKGIEDRVLMAMKTAARDPAYQALSARQKLQEGANLAAQQLLAEAAKGKQRTALTVLAQAKNAQTLAQAGKGNAFRALAGVLDRIDITRKGIERTYFSRLMDTIEAAAPKWLGTMADSAREALLVREIFGQATGDKGAAAGAKAWLETTEAIRQRWNAGGGDTGKLDYGYIPQQHNPVRVREVPADTWAAETLPLLDRSRYMNADGSRMTDAQVLDLLREAHTTITTEGLNKLTPGAPMGSGMRANRHGDARVIHFADADAWLGYHAKYGEGSILTAMQGHISGLSRDIALVEGFGPNPAHAFNTLHDMALLDGGKDMLGWAGVSTESLWRELSGFTSQIYNAHNPVYARAGSIMQGVRNVQVFGKLQGAFLSSLTDIPTFALTLGFNRLPIFDGFVNLLRSNTFAADRAYASRAGLIAESVISDMNRWAENNIGTGWTAKLSTATMRASLLQGWTDAIRRAFSVTMMGALGKMSRADWSALDAGDRARLASKGIGQAEWDLYRQATPENWRGSQMLTPEAVMAVPGVDAITKERAVSRLLAAIVDESEYASVNPDLYSRAAITRGTQRATYAGELLRSIMLFKSFPFAMISRHWGRAADIGGMGGLGYGAALAVGLTTFGALAIQAKDLASGKDPRDMTKEKFWAAAFAQGGGAGILGDILYTGMGGNSRHGQPNWSNLAGPVFSDLAALGDLTFGNIGEAMQGKDTHAGAEAVRFARSHAPFVNLWYAKTAIDHAFMQDVQELLSPGYLARMRQRARDDWGQDFWAPPGEGFSGWRAPELERAFGP